MTKNSPSGWGDKTRAINILDIFLDYRNCKKGPKTSLKLDTEMHIVLQIVIRSMWLKHKALRQATLFPCASRENWACHHNKTIRILGEDTMSWIKLHCLPNEFLRIVWGISFDRQTQFTGIFFWTMIVICSLWVSVNVYCVPLCFNKRLMDVKCRCWQIQREKGKGWERLRIITSRLGRMIP